MCKNLFFSGAESTVFTAQEAVNNNDNIRLNLNIVKNGRDGGSRTPTPYGTGT